MNWTSTKIPLWQIECDHLRKTLSPFELRDVGPEHNGFIEAFTTLYNLECVREGSTITFFPHREMEASQ